ADRVSALEAELAKLQGKEAEFAEAQKAREAESAALAKANDRIRRSEVLRAAKGVLADPSDALRYLDIDPFVVSDDGEIDEAAIAEALADLVTSRPYLARAEGQQKRFQGNADQGARNATTKSEEQRLVDELGEATRGRQFERAIQIRQRLAAIKSA
ncbi:hypothetical protein, partial [Actinotalea sp.]|uniref:hypothetical protein n=1 Tax=Actinotalea sp. TaxID=1872145 RepID=UPI003566AA5F